MPIERADGITESERYLKRLCDRTFLSLWSYPGVYSDEGLVKSKQGKEVCDLLAVFENHIIIFSDKDCQFPNSGNLAVDWNRWFKKSIQKSAQQLWGAEGWIKKYPERLFLDNLYAGFCYVFLVHPPFYYSTYEQYRKERKDALYKRCLVAKLRFPDAQYIVGVATEIFALSKEGRSIDVIHVDVTTWTTEDDIQVKQIEQELKLSQDLQTFCVHYEEYPIEEI